MKVNRLKTCFFLFIIFILVQNASGNDRSFFSFYADYIPFKERRLSVRSPLFPEVMLGVRISPAVPLGIDFSTGMFKRTENINEKRSVYEHTFYHFQVGMLYRMFMYEQGYLGGLVRYGLWTDKAIIDHSQGKEYDTRFTSMLSAGIEPAYLLSEHFGIYCRFGISVAFLPPYKDVERHFDRYDSTVDNYKIVEKKNAQVEINTESTFIGIIYNF